MSMFASFALPPALLAGAVTLLLSLLLPLVVRPVLVKLGVMDVPNERSSHERPILRGLGLAVLVAMLVGGGVGIALLVNGLPQMGWDILAVVLIGSVLAGVLGFAEDLRGLSVKVRSACLLVLGLVTPIVLVWLFNSPPVGETNEFWLVEGSHNGRAAIAGWFAGPGVPVELSSEPVGAVPLPLWLGVVIVPYALLFLSSYVNVANFMDGLNGISGFHGLIAGLTFATAGWLSGLPWLLLMGVVLAAGFAGFLPWNLSKPGAFLGDVGSYLLGGATAITSFAALLAGVPILATIGPMIIYFGDVGVTLVKRVRAGHKWDEPHKEHVYQRLNQLGLSHVAASGITATFTLVASLLGLASFFVAPIWWFALLAAGLFTLAFYLRMPRLLGETRES